MGFQSGTLAGKCSNTDKTIKIKTTLWFDVYFFPVQTIIVNDKCNSQSTSLQTTSVQNMNCVEHDADRHYFTVSGLKYPFARYDFRIYLRTALAGGDNKWSAPGYITVNTNPTSKLIIILSTIT